MRRWAEWGNSIQHSLKATSQLSSVILVKYDNTDSVDMRTFHDGSKDRGGDQDHHGARDKEAQHET